MKPSAVDPADRMVTRTVSGTPTSRKSRSDASTIEDEPTKTPRKKAAQSTPVTVPADTANLLPCEGCVSGNRACLSLGDANQARCRSCLERKIKCSLSRRTKKETNKGKEKEVDDDSAMKVDDDLESPEDDMVIVSAVTPKAKASGSGQAAKAAKVMVPVQHGQRGEYKSEF